LFYFQGRQCNKVILLPESLAEDADEIAKVGAFFDYLLSNRTNCAVVDQFKKIRNGTVDEFELDFGSYLKYSSDDLRHYYKNTDATNLTKAQRYALEQMSNLCTTFFSPSF